MWNGSQVLQGGIMKSILSAFTTALAFSIGAASAAAKPVSPVSGHFANRAVSGSPGSVTLYDQSTGDAGAAISSQNFDGDLDAYDDQGADDFVVPPGHTWKIKEVDVIGQYTGGMAESEHITIYRDAKGVPGRVVADCDGLVGMDSGGTFAIKIPKVCRIMLHDGTYWLAIVANQSVEQWLWEARSPIVGRSAVWQNSKGGWGLCPDWGTLEACFGLPDDLMFALKGKDRIR
jgi:hypothetical protein